MDAFSGVTEFVRITAAKAHDRNFLLHLKLAPLSYVVFDKAYNLYPQFAYWTKKKVWFITRMKDNAVYHVTKVILDKTKRVRAKGVIKVQLVTLGYKDADGVKQRLLLRRITFKADDGRIYIFITNNLSITPEEVASIYKHRWMIELLFKQIKQNFPIRYFWGENENAIRIQVYCVLIAQLLMVVIRKKSATKKSFANIITIVRLHLMSYVELLAFIKDTYKTWRKSIGPPVAQLQLV